MSDFMIKPDHVMGPSPNATIHAHGIINGEPYKVITSSTASVYSIKHSESSSSSKWKCMCKLKCSVHRKQSGWNTLGTSHYGKQLTAAAAFMAVLGCQSW